MNHQQKVRDLKVARERFERLFFELEDSHNNISNKDYLAIIVIQNCDILELLRK